MPRNKSSVWKHCEIIEKDKKKYGKCRFCSKEYSFGNATRMTEHLLSCTQCPYDIKSAFKDGKPTLKKSGASISSTPVREICRASTSNSMELQSSPSPTESSVQISEHVDDSTDKIDAALARAAYCSSLPLSVFESTYWKNALNLLKPNYKPPNKYVMSNALLDAEYFRVKSNIDEKIKRALALGLVTDGWTNICGKSVINFIITTPEPIFYRSIYPGTEKETAAYINAQVVEVIREVGPEKFVAVITDNASNMRAAWRQIQAEYPHIYCIGCAAHSLNLLFGDIMKIECFNKVFQQCKKIIKYITKRHVHLAVFEEKQRHKYGSQSSTLKLPSKTRWAGAILTFQSFLANREALEAFAISQDLQINRNIKTDILSDFFWTNLKVLEETLSPISNEIHHIESDSGLLSEVPVAFQTIKLKIENATFPEDCYEFQNEKSNILSFVENRRKFCVQPIHLAAYMLDPRFHNSVNTNYESLEDNEFLQMTQYLSKVAESTQKDTSEILANFAEYQSRSGFWNNNLIWQPVKNIHPRDWWKGFCSSKPLSSLALRLLSIPPSSAASERNWSIFGRTHTKDRNRLAPERLNKLIYVRSNLNFLQSSDTHSQILEFENAIYSDSESSDIDKM